jgi:hypothetical protein
VDGASPYAKYSKKSNERKIFPSLESKGIVNWPWPLKLKASGARSSVLPFLAQFLIARSRVAISGSHPSPASPPRNPIYSNTESENDGRTSGLQDVMTVHLADDSEISDRHGL